MFIDPSAAAMSLGEPASESAPLFSDDSEAEGPEEQGGVAGQQAQEEPVSGVSRVRAMLTVLILCYINLLNYMDRFTVAGTLQMHDGISWSLNKCRLRTSGCLTLTV